MALNFKRVQKPGQRLRKLLKKMSAEASPKRVHDFRTRSRQLEATLEAFALEEARVGRRVLKPLSRLRRRAGRVRDMDVLTSYAMSVRPRGGEQDCTVQLLEYLGAKRSKYGKRLSSACRQDGSKLRRLLKRAQRKLAKRVVLRDNKKGPAAGPPISVLELGAELGSFPRLNRSNLHPFRLKVKELRNVVKMAEAPDRDLVDHLGAVKDAIGECHDWEELVAIAEKALDHGPSCKMMQELKKTAREKYDRALAEAEQLRKKYLGARGRPGPHRSRPGASETVMRAAMKLAA